MKPSPFVSPALDFMNMFTSVDLHPPLSSLYSISCILFERCASLMLPDMITCVPRPRVSPMPRPESGIGRGGVSGIGRLISINPLPPNRRKKRRQAELSAAHSSIAAVGSQAHEPIPSSISFPAFFDFA